MLNTRELYRVREGIMKRINRGFTMIELMIVVAIVGFLSMISIPSFLRFLSKAKRAEAYMNLGSLYVAQKTYWVEHGTYSTVLSGKDGIGWKPEGYSGGGIKEKFNYTYGFNQGQEGQNYFTGKLNTPQTALGTTKADKDEFTIAAAGYINGEQQPDVLTVNQHNDIRIIKDATAS
jgi:prepilin-type N-terminal cleavage/methylation domain-containing protein